jgi:hypothetical protein
MQQPPKIENCPVCEKPLEKYGIGMACEGCQVYVNPETGEIQRKQKQKAIIKNILGKIKNFIWM